MSKAKYPNRDALRQANDIYLDTMRPFIIHYLKQVPGETVEDLIGGALTDEQAAKFWEKVDENDDIESAIDFSYFPLIIRNNWLIIRNRRNYGFAQRFNEDMTVQSMLWLIKEGRNSCEHRGKKDLDSEFVRVNLFLIADVLGKINKADEQHEVKVIRDELFSDDTKEHLEKAEKRLKDLESEKSEAEKCLATAESEKNEYAEKNAAFSKQVDEKENQRKKLDKQLKRAKTQNDKYKKDIASTKHRLKESEAAQADYKNRLETTSKDLEDAKKEWQACEDSLRSTSDRLEEAVEEWDTCVECLTAMRRLFTIATIDNREVQTIFPPFETDSNVRILDRRGVNKKNYLLALLEQKQPTLIYVQSEEMANLLLERVVPEKADLIEKHGEQTSEVEEAEILEKLGNGELIAVVSDTTLSTLTSAHCVEHFVFCHLVPSLDKFFNQCEPAFTSAENAYLHLIHESKQNVEELSEKYPKKEALRKLYQKFRDCTPTEEEFINLENLYSKLCKESELNITKLGIETGFSIFEELGFLEQNGEGIRRISPPSTKTKLEVSKIYCRGEKLKKEIVNFPAFQYEQSIEQIWKEILEKLNVDSEQILRESNVHKKSLRILETQDGVQSITDAERNEVPASTVDVWPQRGMSVFNSLREQAARNFSNTSNTASTVNERNLSVFGGKVSSPLGEYDLESPIIEEADAEDYRNKYDLAIQFAREHGINILEEGVAQLIKDQDDPDYDFTEDETNMLRAFRDALTDFQTQSEQPTETVENDSGADDRDTEVNQAPEPTRANAKVAEEQVREIRSRSAAGESNSEFAEEDSEKKLEVKQSEFWQPIRDGEFGELFAGRPVPVGDDGWISKRIRGVELILSFRKNRSYVSFLCRGENRIERRDKIIALFPEADYDYSPHESPQRAGFRFPVINKGKDHPEDWDEIRQKLVAMGTDIYNKIDESDL